MCEVNTIAPEGNMYHFPLKMEGFTCPGLNLEECVVWPSEIFHHRNHYASLWNKWMGIMDTHLAFTKKDLTDSKKSGLSVTYIICLICYYICKTYLSLPTSQRPIHKWCNLTCSGQNISLSLSVLLLFPLVCPKFLKIQLSSLITLNIRKGQLALCI